MRRAMAEMRLQLERQQEQQFQPLSLSLSPPREPSPGTAAADIAALTRALLDGQAQQAEQMRRALDSQAQQAEQMRRAQAASAAQMLILRSLGELPTFNGKGADTTLAAQEWLQRAEDYFAVREQALGIDSVLGDKSRLLNAANALTDDARRWYTALPQRPSSWAAFCDAIRARFCSVPDERVRVDRLHEFVDKAARLRDKLNVQGMQAFTARFAQLAGEVPDEYVTQHGKLALLARGLPQRSAEIVLQEDAKKPLPPLHQVINTVLSRAAHKEHAASYSASAAASAAPIGVDAISLAVATFGWSREEARQHLSEGEGWAPHDTQSAPAAATTGQTAPPATTDDRFERLLAALARRSDGDSIGRDRVSSRRNAPADVLKEVPEALAAQRKEAGLCIKCGVAKYEPGTKGHNSRTCKASADKTTSVEQGKKKAGF
jgi:hypothetical protein